MKLSFAYDYFISFDKACVELLTISIQVMLTNY